MKEKRKYITICREGTDFRGYTHAEPETRSEIIEAFYDLGKDAEFDTIKKNYTLNFIMDTWEVYFYYIEGNRAYNMYDRSDFIEKQENGYYY